MRVILITTILFGLAAFSCAQSHDFKSGLPTYGDIVIFKQNEYKYGFPFIVRTSIIEFPQPGQQNYGSIQAIHVKDHYNDGTGGYPTISAGGVGQNFAKIKLKSQRGYGFNFTVTIYGRYI